jgi:hypothetical protein
VLDSQPATRVARGLFAALAKGEGKMRVRIVIYILAILSLAGGAFVLAATDPNAWLLGYWHVVEDEDNTPPDWSEFRSNGVWVNIFPGCSTFEGRWHIFEGDVYVTALVPEKGPIALVFRPSADKHRLSYTSPRTRNNAFMEKVSSVSCKDG